MPDKRKGGLSAAARRALGALAREQDADRKIIEEKLRDVGDTPGVDPTKLKEYKGDRNLDEIMASRMYPTAKRKK